MKHREGLKQLISDVLGGKQEYKAVLVYDISRWGRFQDSDEPAYYEFLCKSAGVQVYYCAELFKNDGALASAVMKALKRVMAAEYGRGGVKIHDAQERSVRLGFKQGGIPGYGLAANASVSRRRAQATAGGRRAQVFGSGSSHNFIRIGSFGHRVFRH